jgi:NAD(P) transhydrogenase subunit beta
VNDALINIAYIFASIFFIFGVKGLSHPRTAPRGNLYSAIGMLIAIVATLIGNQVISWPVIIGGVVVGGLIGALMALKVKMTSVPEMVAAMNGLGGGASTLVAGAELIRATGTGNTNMQMLVATVASALIGTITFSGSLIAFGKLSGKLGGAPTLFKGQHILNGLVMLVALALCIGVVLNPEMMLLYWGLVACALLLGILTVIPIGGADMPVVITLLNSYSGVAAAATGFVLHNNVLIIAGSLVGASGLILTQIMCKAMNRSLANVLFAGVGAEVTDGPSADEVYAGKIKSTSGEEVAMMLDGAQKVVFVPGYGMAVSQAQHAVQALATELENRGVEVLFGVHPVAGRMPGHMNVLLAEANIDYDKLKDMDEINPEFAQTDVVIIIGANDVVNPVARTDPNSPIAGMPILDVDYARTVVMIKRSLSPGYAGIPNPLFAMDNTMMLFGDGKKAIQDILTAVKEG